MDPTQILKNYLFAIEQGDFDWAADCCSAMALARKPEGISPDILQVMWQFATDMKAKRAAEQGEEG
jgi:hypothetical protein